MENKSVAVLRELFAAGQLNEAAIEHLRADKRKGVKQLIKAYENKQKKQKQLEEMFFNMNEFERRNYAKGHEFIAGIDEAGRGPLAGPVVAASVILPKDFKLLGLTDSKQLTEKTRNTMFKQIKEQAISYGIAAISSEEIDRINIFEATKRAMEKSLHMLNIKPTHVLIDAVPLENLSYSTDVITKGDERSISIAAASVLAKVTRDQLMKRIHEQYPVYQFSTNNGYGTKHHLEMLKTHGITPYHRRSYSPVKQLLY